MSTLTLDYITLQTIKTYPYFKKGLNSILIEFSCFIQGYLYYYQQYQKKQQLVLQIQWLLELALLQKFCKCNSGARAFLHKNHQGQHLLGLNKTLMMMMVGRGNCIPTVSCIYFCTHTHTLGQNQRELENLDKDSHWARYVICKFCFNLFSGGQFTL